MFESGKQSRAYFKRGVKNKNFAVVVTVFNIFQQEKRTIWHFRTEIARYGNFLRTVLSKPEEHLEEIKVFKKERFLG